MLALEDLEIGQRIELNNDRQAIVRFLGQTAFAPGDWVGVELDDASGKNDGSVQGERYFECEFKYGMFTRPEAVARILEEPTPRPPKPALIAKHDSPTSATSATSRSRVGATPSKTVPNGYRRQSALDPNAAKRQSINASSPTPAARRQTTVNGLKPTSRTIASTATSSATSSRGGTPSNLARKSTIQPSAINRQSTAANRPNAATVTRSTPALVGTKTGRSQTGLGGTSNTRLSDSVRKPIASQSNVRTNSRLSSSSMSSKQHAPGNVKGRTSTSLSHALDEDENGSNTEAELDLVDNKNNDNDSEVTNETAGSGESDLDMEETEEVNQTYKRDSAAKSKPTLSTPNARKASALAPQASPAPRTTLAGRQKEELEAKLKVLERKRSEDQEKLSRLEKLQMDKDKFEKVIHTLQAKYAPQAKELAALRTRLKEIESKAEEVESIKAEHESEMEMAALDREMAEETAEALRIELDTLRQRAEELQLEVEVLREENEELGKEMDPEERTSKGWLQMERTNERMRDALLRLRDISQEQEAELKERLQMLEEDLKRLVDIESMYQDAREQLERSQTAIDDLKQQLEAATNAEDMVEDLANTNDSLNNEITRLRTEVDELQTINELNDEFEQQHLENERQMQEEIDARGISLQDQITRTLQQEEKLLDYEYTIVKFRELVANLQSDLEDMKASQQLSEVEAEELSSRSKAMTDLNMKLQTSAARTQINTIDLEIRQAEAQEATEHLSIIQMFLPDGFHSERNSILAYLRFKRLTFKARLLYKVLRDSVSNSVESNMEKAFIYCNIREHLAWIGVVCERFSNDIGRCSMERFSRYESSLRDVEPIERALNAHIDAWKRKDFREQLIVEELQRSRSLLDHLSELHFTDDMATYADEIIARSYVMQAHLETTSAALNLVKDLIQGQNPEIDVSDEDTEDTARPYIEEVDTAMSQSRSAKVVVGKFLKMLNELRERSMTVHKDLELDFSNALNMTAGLSAQAQSLGQTLMLACSYEAGGDEAGVEDEPHAYRISSALHSFQKENFPNISNPSTPLAGVMLTTRRTLDTLTTLNRKTSDIEETEEFHTNPKPWNVRAEVLRSASKSMITTEGELNRLRDAMHDRLEQLRLRDQTLEEQNIKIELLESRSKDASETTRVIEELEHKLGAGKAREMELTRAMDNIESEVDSLRIERDRLKRVINQRRTSYPDSAEIQQKRKNESTVISSALETKALRQEINSLKGAMRYLRSTARQGGHIQADNDLTWLSLPLMKSGTTGRKASRRAMDAIERESLATLTHLTRLCIDVNYVDLTKLPEDKLSWQPARNKSRWLITAHAEEWEAWVTERNRCVDHAGTVFGFDWFSPRTVKTPKKRSHRLQREFQ